MKRFLSTASLSLASCVPLFGNPVPEVEPGLLLLKNGKVTVGIDRTKGGSITWLSWETYPKNTVNLHDPGRLIQQSYYAGRRLDRTADGQHKSWSPWSWNPIQGGGVGSWARVTRFEKQDDLILFSETIPKLWDMPDEEAEAVIHQWTSFEPNMAGVLVVKNRLITNRSPDDRWGPAIPSPQEVPACYFTRNFDSFKVYHGEGNWQTVSQQPGPPWGRTNPPLKVMACFNSQGQGIAIYSPTSGDTWNFGPHVAAASDDPNGGPCVHLAPVSRVNLGPQSRFEYRYWIIVGDQESITHRVDDLIAKYTTERARLTTLDQPTLQE